MKKIDISDWILKTPHTLNMVFVLIYGQVEKNDYFILNRDKIILVFKKHFFVPPINFNTKDFDVELIDDDKIKDLIE